MSIRPNFKRPDGSILVKPGDTIGKYCIWIHGRIDTSKFNEYLHIRNVPHRANALGEAPGPKQQLTNVNLIFAGETLYHKPSMPQLAAPVPPQQQPGGELPKLSNGEYDIKRIMEEYKIPSERYEAFRDFLLEKRKAQASVAFIGVFVEFVGFLAFATPIAGVLLGFIASIIALMDNRNAEINYTYMRGVVYGSVSWIYEEKSFPSLPRAIRNPISQSGIPQDLQLHINAWTRGLNAGKQQMQNVCSQNNYDVKGFQAAMRAFTKEGKSSIDENKVHLAASTLVEAADQTIHNRFDQQQFLFPFSYYPHDIESSKFMPNYRDDVAKKYASLK